MAFRKRGRPDRRREDTDEWWGFPDYRPRIDAKGGIKAQSTRGVFGESWWAKRWISVLESLSIGGRLGRGRSYARAGQVLSIEITEGQVNARVQGSRPEPYEVSIGLKPLGESDWIKLTTILSTKIIFAARLLSGEMPQTIEEAFTEAGLSLFPTNLRDLKTECSCPDSSNPCKHIAAVYYLIGEEFDRDPFLLFTLRGKGREEFIRLLGAKPLKRKANASPEHAETLPPEPLSSDPFTFWLGGALPEEVPGGEQIPTVAAALPKRLGNLPFWRGDERFLESLERMYAASASRAADLLVRFGENK